MEIEKTVTDKDMKRKGKKENERKWEREKESAWIEKPVIVRMSEALFVVCPPLAACFTEIIGWGGGGGGGRK
jgi:hypothetical protein